MRITRRLHTCLLSSIMCNEKEKKIIMNMMVQDLMEDHNFTIIDIENAIKNSIEDVKKLSSDLKTENETMLKEQHIQNQKVSVN